MTCMGCHSRRRGRFWMGQAGLVCWVCLAVYYLPGWCAGLLYWLLGGATER